MTMPPDSGNLPAVQPRRFDVVRDDLERAYRRAYDEWEFVQGLAVLNQHLREDGVWKGLSAHLAARADCAWLDLQDYANPEGSADND